MTRKTNLTGSGLPPLAAEFIVGNVGSALTATGADQATALQLSADVNEITTAAASTGVRLPPMSPGDTIFIYNIGANTVSLYPPVGESINAIAVNGAFSVATAKTVIVTKVSATRYATLLTA